MLTSDHFSCNRLKGKERNDVKEQKKKNHLALQASEGNPSEKLASALGGTFLLYCLTDVSLIPLHSFFHIIHVLPAFIWQFLPLLSKASQGKY